MDLYLTIAIIGIGIFLFIKDYFSIDTTSILIMVLFIVSGVLNPDEGFAGFNHPATITLACMFVISAAIFKSGLIDGLSSKIIRIAKINYIFALMIFCFTAALFSAFINDSAIVAILIPMVLLVCRETGISPSRLLIPVSFAALFGGTCTLIGTSTNILVSGYAEESGLEPLGMFEFTLPALCLLAIGLIYIFIVGPLLLPKRENANESGLTKVVEKYMAEIELLEGNTNINKSVGESNLVRDFKVQILRISRGETEIKYVNSKTVLKKNDLLKIVVEPESLARIKENEKFKVVGDKEAEENNGDKFIKNTEENGEVKKVKKEETKVEKKIYEVMIPYGSELAGRSLKQLNFRNSYHTSVLAVRHRKETISFDVSDAVLVEGDMLLLYGLENDINNLTSKKLVVNLSEYHSRKLNYRKAIPAVVITIGVVAAAALDLTSILISAMVGSLLIVTTSILKPKEAYEAIEWKVIFMMAGVLSMGKALEKTGGSDNISQFIFETMGDFDSRITLSLIFLITFLSTNVLSSKAAAALMAPIVISLAAVLEVSERPFLVAVMFACSLTFMTPVSYPTNTMVYAPGNYKFTDFIRFGTPLNFIIWIAASFIIPIFFPF